MNKGYLHSSFIPVYAFFFIIFKVHLIERTVADRCPSTDAEVFIVAFNEWSL